MQRAPGYCMGRGTAAAVGSAIIILPEEGTYTTLRDRDRISAISRDVSMRFTSMAPEPADLSACGVFQEGVRIGRWGEEGEWVSG
jgi:hypothetical protein